MNDVFEPFFDLVTHRAAWRGAHRRGTAAGFRGQYRVLRHRYEDGVRAACRGSLKAVPEPNPTIFHQLRWNRFKGSGPEPRERVRPYRQRSGGAGEPGRVIVVVTHPGNRHVAAGESGEPTVARIGGRAGLTGDDRAPGQTGGCIAAG